MAGIYIHIPFCKQACNYCNFHFSTSLRYKNELIDALLKEINLKPDFFKVLPPETVETIYFGGGTPSLLTTDEISSIIRAIQNNYAVSGEAEITLEANPDDISEEKLISWKAVGINRLSIGIQSFFEEDLRWMNRAHTASQAIENLRLAISHFNNITIDLIYGTPGLTNEKWQKNVQQAIDLNIPHLSCYALTVEPKTPLDKLIRQHKKEDVNPDFQSEQFLLLMDWLTKAGYEHYEISNFARPGYRSRHNSSYWRGKPYLGIGPSAHSFNVSTRWWNIANNARYIESINQGVIPFEKEELTNSQRINEYIMISLRTAEGIEMSRLDKKNREFILKESSRYINSGKMIEKDGFLQLTREGKLLADGIAAGLFVTEDF